MALGSISCPEPLRRQRGATLTASHPPANRTPTPLVERRKWQKPAVLAAHGRVCGNPASRIIKYIDLHIKPMLLTKTDIVNDKN